MLGIGALIGRASGVGQGRVSPSANISAFARSTGIGMARGMLAAGTIIFGFASTMGRGMMRGRAVAKEYKRGTWLPLDARTELGDTDTRLLKLVADARLEVSQTDIRVMELPVDVRTAQMPGD
jgi:hypothetical protein